MLVVDDISFMYKDLHDRQAGERAGEPSTQCRDWMTHIHTQIFKKKEGVAGGGCRFLLVGSHEWFWVV